MSARPGATPRFSLWRWSQRKLEAKAAQRQPALPATPAPAAAQAAAAPAELPPVESLTFESDFAAFLRPEVDDRLKRAALKQLFRDPRFNVMDGLDTYIDDYTKADPIAPDVCADLLRRGFGGAPDAAGPEAAAGGAPRAQPAVPAEGPAADPPAAEVVPPPALEAAPPRFAELPDVTGAGEVEPAAVKRTDGR